MRDSVSIGLKGNMSFDVVVNRHKMTLDAGIENGGDNEGPRPKSLMLVALAGCTGMDIVSLLRKMRVGFDDLRIDVEGNVTEEHPKHFDHMHIKYIVKGNNIPADKVNKAIDLSLEKYCGVSYTYSKSMNITHELIIEE
jgi:putative redox protein